ncbi:H-NS histone family protein [Massilia sp. YIM B02769]|nr:H-NS histone family protein [Massilia sp. YIM B02769]
MKPQYENPADSSQTWSGRGRQPKWVAEALAGGKKLDQFRMK